MKVLLVCPLFSPTARTWAVTFKSTPARLSLLGVPFSSNSIRECFPFSACKTLATCEIKRDRCSCSCYDIFKICWCLFTNSIDIEDVCIHNRRNYSYLINPNLDTASAIISMLHFPINEVTSKVKIKFIQQSYPQSSV